MAWLGRIPRGRLLGLSQIISAESLWTQSEAWER